MYFSITENDQELEVIRRTQKNPFFYGYRLDKNTRVTVKSKKKVQMKCKCRGFYLDGNKNLIVFALGTVRID